MNRLLSHFRATPKSVGAALVAIVGVLAAFDLISAKAAAALGAAAAPILALLVPAREGE